MKKLLLMIMTFLGANASNVITANQQAYAADSNYTYGFLTFVTTDGAKASVPVSSLVLTINDNILTAGTISFPLSNLSKMYFSTTDETATGINQVSMNELDECKEIYDLRGNKVSIGQIKKGGVYLVKTNSKTYKMIVK